MQIVTTVDYATDSWFWSVFTGDNLFLSSLLPLHSFPSPTHSLSLPLPSPSLCSFDRDLASFPTALMNLTIPCSLPGGLNHQTTHHLFPGVCQYYYPQITPIVRDACKKFGVRYNYLPTFSKVQR